MFEIWLIMFFVVGFVVSLHRLSSVRSMAGYNTTSPSMRLHLTTVYNIVVLHIRIFWLFNYLPPTAGGFSPWLCRLQSSKWIGFAFILRSEGEMEQSVSAWQTCCAHSYKQAT
ncbi:hypothetical protein J3459_008247 [Metarhizium acridum]|nr:hypothetical protein J3459_018618 [Metarhizium acridum]KAG8408256.1 hypothetical protein J3459_018027 [Metarhizium acridum]KAG8426333.1 hypothetical protein J3459_008247 [Metarhizium acridum]